jgi:Uma2 family endonuclease
MATQTISLETDWTVSDLQERFGPIPFRRIRQEPAPGAATEQDAIDIRTHEKRLYELVDGVLVEKTMGLQEAFLAAWLLRFVGDFVQTGDLGIVLGPDGMARLAPGLIRIPDVSFIGWDRFPGKRIPAEPMLPFSPHLAIEVLSPGNTRQEMQRKLVEYFDSGSTLVWYVDPRSRTIRVFTSPEAVSTLSEGETLGGGKLLPGFQLPVSKVFEQLERAK